jgi:hypothetical protein
MQMAMSQKLAWRPRAYSWAASLRRGLVARLCCSPPNDWGCGTSVLSATTKRETTQLGLLVEINEGGCCCVVVAYLELVHN